MQMKYHSKAYPIIGAYLKRNSRFFTHEYDDSIKQLGRDANVYMNSEVWNRMFRYFKSNTDVMAEYGIRSVIKIRIPDKKEYLWKVSYIPNE